MSVKEGCFLLGLALLRIRAATELAAWAANNKRFEEASKMLSVTGMEIATGLAAGQITSVEAEEMRGCIEKYKEAVEKGDREAQQDRLAELTVKATDIAFEKLAQCECRER